MNIKGLFIFIAGAVTGAGGMYFSMKKYFEAKTEVAINAKVNEELDKIHGVKKEPPEVLTETEVEEEAEPAHKEGPNLDIYKQVLEKKNYSTISKDEKVTTLTDAIEEEVKEIAKKPAKKVKAPKRITQEEYDSTEEGKKIELQYYADDILADVYDKTYDPVETMGAANLKSFKAHYDTMYIMNYATGMVYEVTFSNSNFRDISGGVGAN